MSFHVENHSAGPSQSTRLWEKIINCSFKLPIFEIASYTAIPLSPIFYLWWNGRKESFTSFPVISRLLWYVFASQMLTLISSYFEMRTQSLKEVIWIDWNYTLSNIKILDLNLGFKITEMLLKPAPKTVFLNLPNLPFLLWRNCWQTFAIKGQINTSGFAGHKSVATIQSVIQKHL